MNMRDIVKNAPNPILWVCGTIIFVTIVAAFVVFGVTGSDASEFKSFLNILLNVVATLFAGGAFVTASAAAKSASKAEEQTNGQLKENVKAAVHEVINGDSSGR